MGKLRLDLRDLKVDSFDTGARTGSGTVFGQGALGPHGEVGAAMESEFFTWCCPNDSVTSYGSCGTTCQPEGAPETCGGVGACGASTWQTMCITGCQACDHCN